MPCRWRDVGLEEFVGQVRCRRRFGYPGRIDANERVWLTFAGFSQRADIALNGLSLGSKTQQEGPCEFDVTALLQARNELLVTVTSAAGENGLWGEVALEVRRTAFLQGVQAQVRRSGLAVTIEVAGSVVGSSTGPLDLYALCGGRTVAYAQVQPVEPAIAFELMSEPLERDFPASVAVEVGVELVEGGVIWYSLSVPLRNVAIS
jgi:hypothetical protein